MHIVFVYLYTMLGFYFAALLARILDANAINILCLLNVPLFISPHAGKKAYPKHRAHKIIITIIVQHDIQPTTTKVCYINFSVLYVGRYLTVYVCGVCNITGRSATEYGLPF